jgi:hypothetical protein
MSRYIHFAAAAAIISASVSCGSVVRDGRSPVIVTVRSLSGGSPASNPVLSDVVVNRTSPAPCSSTSPCPTIVNDAGTATLAVTMKNTTVGPTVNNQVTINRYHVEFVRADGRNTPGVDVPYAFDGGATASIAAGSTGAVTFDLVRHTAKQESPLAQLVVSSNFISTIATVTFYGTDAVGNVVSASGQMSITFGNFGDQ